MQQIKIAPSLLALKDLTMLESELKKLEIAGSDLLHIDVMDGIFVENKSIFLDAEITKRIRKATTLPLDIHLMVQEPEKYTDLFLNAGADMISFHCESIGVHSTLIKKIQEAGKKAGIAINPTTSVEQVFPLCENADFILVMSVVPGKGGQTYIDHINEKIKELRHLFPTKDIEVDGGINTQTAYLPLNAGANILVSGTGIFNSSNYRETIEQMKQMILLGADHAGYAMKNEIKQWLQSHQYAVKDLGPFSDERCDYPDYAKKVAGAVSADPTKKGILICGTGIGMSIAANKYPHVHAAHVSTEQQAMLAKQHNNANIICLGSRTNTLQEILKYIDLWLHTPFERGRHQERIEKIEANRSL